MEFSSSFVIAGYCCRFLVALPALQNVTLAVEIAWNYVTFCAILFTYKIETYIELLNVIFSQHWDTNACCCSGDMSPSESWANIVTTFFQTQPNWRRTDDGNRTEGGSYWRGVPLGLGAQCFKLSNLSRGFVSVCRCGFAGCTMGSFSSQFGRVHFVRWTRVLFKLVGCTRYRFNYAIQKLVLGIWRIV